MCGKLSAALQGSMAVFNLGLILSSCSIDENRCDLPAIPFPLQINVRDSVTGRGVALGAWGTVDAFGIHDTLVNFGNDTLTLYSRSGAAGIYRVDLHRSGYQDWTMSGVKISGSECGSVPVLVTARLQPVTS